jgi:O-antigen/teichoic acid export membrane protein
VKGYSLDSFLAMLAGRITVQTGAIVVGGFAGVVAAAHYSVAARLIDTAKGLLRAVTSTLTPTVSEREATGDLAGVRSVFLGGTRWVLYLMLPVHLGILAYGRPFLARWVGAEYADVCFPAAAIMSATLTIGVAQSAASRILYGMGKLRLFARLALAEAVLNLALSLALVGPFGVEGVAVAVAGPNLLFCVATIAYAARVLDVGAVAYLRAAWLRPLLAAVVPTVVWAQMPPAEAAWGAIAFGIACGVGPYALTVAALEWAGRGPGAAVPGRATLTENRAAPPEAPPLPRVTVRG